MRSAPHELLAICIALVVVVQAPPPEDLSNFQNEHACNPDVRLVRPQSVSDIEEAVQLHSHVVAVGVGHNYNQEFFCPPSPDETEEESDTTASIAMTSIRPLSIHVEEDEMSAWVSAGVIVWDLMVYLGNYVTPRAPRGYALGAVPAFVNQTIGGGVATGTYGSSLTHGSLSAQAIGFRVVLANGTTTVIDSDRHPFYFKAFKVSVGRLGVVTDVKMRIIKETLVKRTLQIGVPRADHLGRLREAQEMYQSTGTFPAWAEIIDFLYIPTNKTFLVLTLEDAESDSADEGSLSDPDFLALVAESKAFCEEYLTQKINAPFNYSRSEPGQSIASGVKWEQPMPFEANLLFGDASNSAIFIAQAEQATRLSLNNATGETHEAGINLPPAFLENELVAVNDDYDVAVHADKMADCLEGLMDLVDSMGADNGLRFGVANRLVGMDTGLLSATNDKPRLYIGMQDYVYYNREERSPNLPFRRLIAFLVTSPLCSPTRLHWSKGGWPDPGCWNGAEVFSNTWCDFGCAVRDLDPNGKFAGNFPEVWNWEGAHLDRCCTEDGYDTSLEGCECSVIPVRTPEECPEAPFYTNR